jgi:NAD(P)-dependent dehydrogenase (short-subunit alcohol dehydrogenase family)
MDVRGVPVVVTGGASGLGEATVRALVLAGADVAVLDRDRDRGAAIAGELGVLFADCDVADPSSIETAYRSVVDQGGAPRVAIACAGIGAGNRLVGRRGPHDLEVWDRVVKVNLSGTFHLFRLAAWDMATLDPVGADGERGVLISTSSIAAFDGVDGGVAYSASKAGVAGMTLPLARDLASDAIRAVSIAPGSFETPLVGGMPEHFRRRLSDDTPFPPRFGQPAEFARLALHIVENPMLNGTVIRLDGGLRMRPSDRR